MQACVRSAALALVGLVVASGTALAEIRTDEITYTLGDKTFRGYLAWNDEIDGERPGVLVVHEWWGQNDHARERAERLAELGYTGFAVDMYGDGEVATNPEDAKRLMTSVMSDPSVARGRFDRALAILKENEVVDPDRIAAMGFCMGGGVVLHVARTGTDLDGVITYHGVLGTDQPAKPGSITTPIRVFNGDADPFVPPEQLKAFETEMSAAAEDIEIINYPEVVHSFTNPGATELGEKFGLPLRYDAAADRDSWERTEAFLSEVLGK